MPHPTYPDHTCLLVLLRRICENLHNLLEDMLVLNFFSVVDPSVCFVVHPFRTIVILCGIVCGDELFDPHEAGMTIVAR